MRMYACHQIPLLSCSWMNCLLYWKFSVLSINWHMHCKMDQSNKLPIVLWNWRTQTIVSFSDPLLLLLFVLFVIFAIFDTFCVSVCEKRELHRKKERTKLWHLLSSSICCQHLTIQFRNLCNSVSTKLKALRDILLDTVLMVKYSKRVIERIELPNAEYSNDKALSIYTLLKIIGGIKQHK